MFLHLDVRISVFKNVKIQNVKKQDCSDDVNMSKYQCVKTSTFQNIRIQNVQVPKNVKIPNVKVPKSNGPKRQSYGQKSTDSKRQGAKNVKI